MYDAQSASDDETFELFGDNRMYPMYRSTTYKYPPGGTGQMVVGRNWVNENRSYGAAVIDDLKMWNRNISDEEIVAMSN